MTERLLLFGATGDLAGRFLLPALAGLHGAGRLPANFRVFGSATTDWDDETFRQHAARQLEKHAGRAVSAASRDAVVRSLRYRKVDFSDRDNVARVVAEAGEGSADGAQASPF